MIIDCAHYKGGERQHDEQIELERAAEIARDAESGEFAWIGLHEPEPGDLAKLRELFGLHELAIEDAERMHQRPKIEDYDDAWFIVLRTAHYHEDTEVVHFGEVHVFAGPGYVVTIRHGPGSELDHGPKAARGAPRAPQDGRRGGGVGDPRQGRRRLLPGRRRDRGRHRGGRGRRLRRRAPGPDRSASTR